MVLREMRLTSDHSIREDAQTEVKLFECELPTARTGRPGRD
jgi:hypothetical protein